MLLAPKLRAARMIPSSIACFSPTSLRSAEPTLRTVVKPASSMSFAFATAVIPKKLSVNSSPRSSAA